jgi:hypothetical protein
MKPTYLLALFALAGGALAFGSADGAERGPTWIEPPVVPEPERRCSEPAEHAAHRASAAERAAHERAEVFALVPSAALTARARFAEARACATLAGDAAGADRIARVAATFDQRFAREYTAHAERYRLARRAARPADASASVAFFEAVWTAAELDAHPQRAAFVEQLRVDAVAAQTGDRS